MFIDVSSCSSMYILKSNDIPGNIYGFIGVAVLEFIILLEW